MKIFFSILVLLSVFYRNVICQSLPLSISNAREMAQIGQLSGIIPLERSLNLWPIHYNNMFSFEMKSNLDTINNSFFNFCFLPLLTKNRYSLHHPDGMNDGLMIPARGFQTFFSTGFFLKTGPLEFQIFPEYVHAENKPFFGQDISNGLESVIDIPNRFGNDKFRKLDWGQSSIRFSLGPISFGITNENLWWGPGRNNAIIMSNNAPGFLHGTFKTHRPIITPLGNFEFEMIGGYIKPSGFSNKTIKRVYLNSGIISFQPKFLKGLSGGLTRSFMQEDKKYSNWKGYFPILSGLTKTSLGGTAEDAINRNQLLSIFAKYVLPNSHAQFYFEFGKEDHNWDIRDIILEYAHSRVYLTGFRKLVSIPSSKDSYILLSAELSHLIKPLMTVNRNRSFEYARDYNFRGLGTGGDFYQYGNLQIGYTNEGQYLGAGIGTGGSQTMFEISWIKGMKKIGLIADRRVHEGDYSNSKWPGDMRFRWVDLSVTPVFNWDLNNMLLHISARNVKSFNYRHIFTPRVLNNDNKLLKGKGLYNLLFDFELCFFINKPKK